MASCQESYQLKRTFLLAMLAVFSAALVSVSALAQAAPEAGPAPAPLKYEVYAGFAYTSLNQVNTSRYGLMGGEVALTRDWGRYFGLRGSGDYYRVAAGHGLPGNPGNPSVYSILGGPELHVTIYGPVAGLLFGELGMEHTGGEGMIPDTSFAGGFGGGMAYNLNRRWAIRVTGERVLASFSLINNTPQMANSTHRTANSRASVGLVFHF